MTQYVHGEGPVPCDVILIGESPGREEDKYGRPFMGKTGTELNRYLFRSTGRTRTSVYATNLIKYRCADDEGQDIDPTPFDIERDSGALNDELRMVGPEVIVTLGRWATRRFLGDVDMEAVHGVVHCRDGQYIVPCFHPAAGLHSTEFQGLIYWDFEQLGKLLRGEIEEITWETEDEWASPRYVENSYLFSSETVAIDTEGSVKAPWCLSASRIPGHAIVVRPDASGLVPFSCNPPISNVVMHNALHDMAVLRAMGIKIDKFDDTMLKAYLLCVEPQGLKALAKRHCGMAMSDYWDLIGEQERLHAAHYMWRMAKWLDKQSSSGSTELQPTTTGTHTKPTSGSVGRKSRKTSPRKPRK